ncbi:unnamed protein product [Mucor hiemalis]
MLRICKNALHSSQTALKAPVRTLATYNSPSRPVSDRALTPKEREFIEPMIRVDQAGEVGAYYIYKGQIAVLGHDKKLRPILQEIPSLLRPIWEVAGFAVGYGTAMIGKEAAMACTEAVETVIGNHYDDQLRELTSIKDHNQDLVDLSQTVAQFRDEELEHHDIAVAHDAQLAPLHSVMKAVIMQGCKTAIWVASRV